MAIYYLSPWTSTNGTGTFASPWSFSSSTRTGLANGDEIRIISAYKEPTAPFSGVFTATTYSVYRSADHQIIVTAGGSLGSDFAIGSVIYFPSFDTFCLVMGVSGNTLTLTQNSFQPSPWPDTRTGVTITSTIRKVDTATWPASSTTTNLYILGSSAVSNVVVSDGWVDATTRVTDGSAKSFVYVDSATATTVGLYLDTSSTPSEGYGNNYFFLENTHFAGTRSTLGPLASLFRSSNSYYSINQIHNQYSQGYIQFGTGLTSPIANVNINIKNFSTYSTFITTSYGSDITLSITNLYQGYGGFFWGVATGYTSPNKSLTSNVTFNLTNCYFINYEINTPCYVYNAGPEHAKTTYNFISTLDYATAATPGNIMYGSGGDITVTNTATVYRNRRASTGASTISNRLVAFYNQSTTAYGTNDEYHLYTANLMASTAVTTNVAIAGYSNIYTSTTVDLAGTLSLKKPKVITVNYDSPYNASGNTYGITNAVNTLQVYRYGSDPIEVLGIINRANYRAVNNSTLFPNVFRDTVTKRSTGPSLRSYLATRTAAYWTYNGTRSSSIKNIKIPIVSGSTYTITGYIRSDYSSSTTGDVSIYAIIYDSILASQNMTSAMYNSWEQFTLSFTASVTGEAYLAWEMYYPTGAMSYWLDDLSISKT